MPTPSAVPPVESVGKPPAPPLDARLTSAPEVERTFQRRMYWFNVSFLMLLWPLYMGIAIIRGNPANMAAIGFIFICLMVNLLLVRRSGAFARGLFWLQTTSFLGVVLQASQDIRVDTPGFWWMSVMPVVTLLCGLTRLGLVQGAVTISYAILAFLVNYSAGDVSTLALSFRLHLAVVLSTVYVCANLCFAMFWRGKLQAALQEATVAALASADAKARFLAHMSHEIRTPLNGVIGAAALLRSTRTEEQRHQLALLQEQSAQSLLALINHVLDWSKLEAGKVQLETQPISLRALVSEANELFAVTAFDKRIELTSSCNPDVPRRLQGDATRIRQILNNLVSNAIKFTDKGGVHIHLAMSGTQTPDGRAWLRVEVADSGIGIAAAALARVFEAFQQADQSVTRRYGGTGLGLSISKELAGLMDGRIEASSEPGQGSTFTLTLPLRRLDAEPSNGAPTAHPEVVVASASPGLTRHLRSLLQELHIEPQVVRGLPADADLQHCQILLLDAPLLDAAASGAAGLLQRLAQRGIRTGVLQALGSDIAFDGAAPLYKPVRLSALQAFLDPRAEPEVQPSLLGVQAGGPHVLLCEDNPVNQLVVQVMLTELGATTVVAGNGRDALACLQGERFDLVLMDMQMPEMDGLTATREWRRIEQLEPSQARLPIVCMTANSRTDEGLAATAAGMDDFLSKPFGLRELRECVDRWLPHAQVVHGEE